MVVIMVRLSIRLVSADGTIVYLFTYIKSDSVSHTRCGLGRIDSVHKTHTAVNGRC